MFNVRRRELIALLGGTAAWPLAARAQQAAKLPTIGYLGPTTPSAESQRLAVFIQRLHELGWIEGRNIAIEVRWAEGPSSRAARARGRARPAQGRCHCCRGNRTDRCGKAGYLGHTDRLRAGS